MNIQLEGVGTGEAKAKTDHGWLPEPRDLAIQLADTVPRYPATCWARGSRHGAAQLLSEPLAQAALPRPRVSLHNEALEPLSLVSSARPSNPVSTELIH